MRNKKLKGMPKVYYFNLDCDTDRKYFMESQFKNYGIKYERVSQSKYTKDNFYKWVYNFERHDQIIQAELNLPGSCVYAANFLRHLDFMSNWLKTTEDDLLMVMEDDYDLSLIDYWHFDWSYFIDNLPVDWDAFRLNDDHLYKIKFFVHPINKEKYKSFGTMLFKRDFVKKILSFYDFYSGKIKISLNHMESNYSLDKFSVDTLFTIIGSIYTAPLITTEASFCKDKDHPLGENASKEFFSQVQNACHHWWRNERDFFTLEDFFYYGKPYDEKMTIRLHNQIR